ncbi:helix-turn-helix domain-containing protein [Pseudomonas sp. SP16.1]|uniref:helix-turn-helix domain-containing protein n=1 Tax=Pseudomonas sp. SP16.1 TaxID=3458854 RepID=UPI0040460F8C
MKWSSGNTQPAASSKATAEVFSFEAAITPPKRQSKFSSISAFILDIEKEKEHKDGIAKARKWVAETQYAGSKKTLKLIRMSKGLSQKALGDLTGTSQSHIARIEAGREDVRLSTLKKLSQALGLTLDELSQLIENKELMNAEEVK